MKTDRDYWMGHLSVFMAFAIWGFLTIYWKQIDYIPAVEILAHRVFWSFIFLLLFTLALKRKGFIQLLRDKKKRRSLYVTGVLISINWVLYIYAVNSKHILQASLGYYINPLVSVFLGMVFLKERLTKLQITALVLALFGVLYLTFDYGKVPWLAIILAVSFAFYGLFKKKFALDSMNSLLVETFYVMPIALGYMLYLGIQKQGHFITHSGHADFYLILGGIATIVPLFLFADGTKRIPLSSVGFLQYFAPSIMLLLGVFMYDEPFTRPYIISFICIWIGLIFYTYSLFRIRKKRKMKNNP